MSDERPNVKMSDEERSAHERLNSTVADLAGTVRVLADGVKRNGETLDTFMKATDARFKEVQKTGELSWSKVGSVILFVLAIGSPLYSILSMKIEGSLAPVRQDQVVAVSERSSDHARILSLEERMGKTEDHQTAADAKFIERNERQDERIGEHHRKLFGYYPRN